MFTLFVIGNLASGKSTTTRYLASRGARRIDLDQLAKDLYVPGSDVVAELADAFGADILDDSGSMRTAVLAQRAFATPERSRVLNDIVLPRVHEALQHILLSNTRETLDDHDVFTVVEVSLAREFADAFSLADEVMAITAPLKVRLARATDRGMDAADAERRASLQPSEDELCALATCVIDNTAADETLFARLDQWLMEHGLDEHQQSSEISDV